MSQEDPVEANSLSTTPPEVKFSSQEADIYYPDLELTVDHPTTPEVAITFKKHPLLIIEGKSYGNQTILVDKESEKMQELGKQAESLKDLPENERLREN